MDFIFGTFATDELKLVHHRAAHRGIQHNHQRTPLDPLPGEPIMLYVRTGTDHALDNVVCYYTTDGTFPQGSHGASSNGHTLTFQQTQITWDSPTWGYNIHWQAALPPQPEGTVLRYKIGGWSSGSDEIFADSPNAQIAAEEAAAAFFRGEPIPASSLTPSGEGTTFTLHIDRLQPPDWARKAVIYHIFVDRFNPGRGNDWLQTTDLEGFCGGTLWGVLEKLDYIADLGATCIWLSPTFVSLSSHGYDITDYRVTEPRLGGDDALRAVINAAHQRGLRVLLDLVCNHMSNQHPSFVSALNDPSSPYRNWFIFDDSPVGYRSFFGTHTMPQINLANPAARQWMLDVAQYWLREFGVDGYRLDYANGPGPDFWGDFRAACRAVNPDCFVFGEVVDAPEAQRTYTGQLDGCLDFHTGDMLRKAFGWGTTTPAELARFLMHHRSYFGDNLLLPTFLDNHDMDRFLFIANGSKDALKRAAQAQMQMLAPAIIYYGTEIGLTQTSSTRDSGLHVSRTPMLWDEGQDHELLAFYKALIRERKHAQ